MASPPDPANTPRTAIITGAASGMGLAVSKHLLSKGWRVLLADVDPTRGATVVDELRGQFDPAHVRFKQCDVSTWAENLALFKEAWAWSGRIDLFGANAGIADRDQIVFEPTNKSNDLDADPDPYDMTCVTVDLLGPLHSLKCFVHFARRTKKVLPDVTPKFITTASTAGLYGFVIAPQYCAAKHGLVGLVRAVGPRLKAQDGITVNAVCPGFVITNLTSHMNKWPKERTTPMQTILKAWDALIDDDSKSGETVEVSMEDLYWRKQLDFPDESQRWIIEEAEHSGAWSETM